MDVPNQPHPPARALAGGERRPAARRWLRSLALTAPVLAACAGIGESELQRAIAEHEPAKVRELLAAGASTQPTFAEPRSAAELALASVEDGNPASIEVLRLFLAANPQPIYIGIEAARPPPRRLADATFPRRKGKDIDHKMPPISAVEIVTRRSSREAVQALLDAGLTVPGEGATNALVDAVRNGQHEIAELLLVAGADANGQSTAIIPLRYPLRGMTPLEAATETGDADMVALLVAQGAR